MKCRKCKAEISDDFLFCPICGTKQTAQQKTKSRGNGTGSVYQLPNKSWIAVRVLGYKIGADGKNTKIPSPSPALRQSERRSTICPS